MFSWDTAVFGAAAAGALYVLSAKRGAAADGATRAAAAAAERPAGGAGASTAASATGATHPDGKRSAPGSLNVDGLQVMSPHRIDAINWLKVPQLQERLPAHLDAKKENVRWSVTTDMGQPINYRNTIDENYLIVGGIIRHVKMGGETYGFVRAGPRARTWFDPAKVRAAVVTCGGLCPGLNNVIREIVRSLSQLYGVDKVLGIREGYSGFYTHAPIELTMETVRDIHHWGGTVLGSSRGGFDDVKIVDKCVELGINQLYIIGGDGSHRGAAKLASRFEELKLNVGVACVPKTVDNDIAFIDRSFGFATAVEEAQRAILSAKTEAKCAPNGIGIVKLMGRSSGYIATHATLASGDADLCLVPELPTVLEGDMGCLPHVDRVLQRQGHAVIVVAEGVGEELLGADPSKCDRDPSGNIRLPPIAPWLKDRVVEYFEKRGKPVNVKVLDPSYMIRSVRASAQDSIYCMLLAQNAVHGAMAGFTDFSVGLCNNRLVYLPVKAIVQNSPQHMNPYGRTWERILSCTRQPNTSSMLRDAKDDGTPIVVDS